MASWHLAFTGLLFTGGGRGKTWSHWRWLDRQDEERRWENVIPRPKRLQTFWHFPIIWSIRSQYVFLLGNRGLKWVCPACSILFPLVDSNYFEGFFKDLLLLDWRVVRNQWDSGHQVSFVSGLIVPCASVTSDWRWCPWEGRRFSWFSAMVHVTSHKIRSPVCGYKLIRLKWLLLSCLVTHFGSSPSGSQISLDHL